MEGEEGEVVEVDRLDNVRTRTSWRRLAQLATSHTREQ